MVPRFYGTIGFLGGLNGSAVSEEPHFRIHGNRVRQKKSTG